MRGSDSEFVGHRSGRRRLLPHRVRMLRTQAGGGTLQQGISLAPSCMPRTCLWPSALTPTTASRMAESFDQRPRSPCVPFERERAVKVEVAGQPRLCAPLSLGGHPGLGSRADHAVQSEVDRTSNRDIA
jgi:hypothetical protein